MTAMLTMSLAAAPAAGIFLTASTLSFAQARTTTALKNGYLSIYKTAETGILPTQNAPAQSAAKS
jgi:hypothetical protein